MRTPLLSRCLGRLLLVAAVAACGETTPPVDRTSPVVPSVPATPTPPAPQPTVLQIVGPDTVRMDAGPPASFQVELRDDAGRTLPLPADVKWSTTDQRVAALEDRGGGRASLVVRQPWMTIGLVATAGNRTTKRAVVLTRTPPPVAGVTFCCGDVVRVGDSVSVFFTPFDASNTRIETFGLDAPWFAGLPWNVSDTSALVVRPHPSSPSMIDVVGRKIGTITISPRIDGVSTSLSIRVLPALPPPGALADVVAGGLSWRQLSGGDEHTCGLTTDGAVYCWGAISTRTARGYVGYAPLDTSMAPARYPLPVPAIALGAAAGYACAAGTDEAVYCWGENPAVTKVRHPLPNGADVGRIVSIAAGGGHACALTGLGRVACWGYADAGQLGVGGSLTSCSTGPSNYACRPDAELLDTELRFTSLAAGATFTCGLAADGEAYCWGNTALGGPTPTGESCQSPGGPYAGSFAYPCRRTPLAVTGGHRFESLAAAAGRACGVSGGAVWCWSGQEAPTLTPNVSGVHALSLGTSHACAITTGDRVLCWGGNRTLALGVASPDSTVAPVAPSLSGGALSSLASGASHSCAIDRTGAAVCWGAQRGGQLGRGRFAP